MYKSRCLWLRVVGSLSMSSNGKQIFRPPFQVFEQIPSSEGGRWWFSEHVPELNQLLTCLATVFLQKSFRSEPRRSASVLGVFDVKIITLKRCKSTLDSAFVLYIFFRTESWSLSGRRRREGVRNDVSFRLETPILKPEICLKNSDNRKCVEQKRALKDIVLYSNTNNSLQDQTAN